MKWKPEKYLFILEIKTITEFIDRKVYKGIQS
jgi:hypothetical protein